MNNRFKRNYVLIFIFVAILFLYLTVFENDICGSANYSYASHLTNIEVIYQPELPEEFQPYNGSSSVKKRKAHGSFYLENIFKCAKDILFSVNNFSTSYLKNQNNYALNFHHIISILQKSNTWHQSSDDDSFLNDYC